MDAMKRIGRHFSRFVESGGYKPMRFFKAILAAALFSLALGDLCQAQTCLSGPTLIQDDSYMTFEVKNDCAGEAVIHYELRHPDGRLEADNWHVAKCGTARFQYFKGEYKFTVDVDDSKTCVPSNASRSESPGRASNSPGSPKVGSGGTSQIPDNGDSDFLSKYHLTRAQALQKLQGALDACTAHYPCNVADKITVQNIACVMHKRDCYRNCEEIPTMLGYPADIIKEFCSNPSNRYP
jgi:hypothetical protein